MNSYSQAGQDRFVYAILNHKPDGTFLDIGCHDGHRHSNSLGLEELGWTGLLVDIQTFPGLARRKSDFLIADCVTTDWRRTLELYLPGRCQVDYLSIDVDESTTNTLAALMKALVRFRVITVEHDSYRLGTANAVAQRNLLAPLGYELMAKDVCVGPGEWGAGGPFEDWWVSHELMTGENFGRFGGTNQLGTSIVANET
jgi:hypothetical protein